MQPVRGSHGAVKVLVCLLTVKSKGTIGTVYVTQGSIFAEMNCSCHSLFSLEVRDFYKQLSHARQEGRNKGEPQR